MPAGSKDAFRQGDDKRRELAWTRERLLLKPLGVEVAPSLARSYEELEARKRALEREIAESAQERGASP